MDNNKYLIRFSIFFIIIIMPFIFISKSFAEDQSVHNTVLSNDAIFKSAQNTNWFEQGNPKAAHQLYVIAEPNCSACHYFYESIKPYIAKGQVSVRWILVAFVNPSSPGKVAAIISSKNPAQALEYNESAFDDNHESGSISPLTNISESVKQNIVENIQFMKDSGFHSTPILLFKNADGHISVLQGAPPQDKIAELVNFIGSY